MPDDTTTDDLGQTDDTAVTDDTSTDDAAVATADKPDAVKNAIRRHQEEARKERKRAEAAEAKAREYEDRDKSAQEKADQRASEAEKKATALETKLLRLEVAADKKVPSSLAARLQGETKEELEADADELLKQVRPESATDFDQGARGTAKNDGDMDSMIRRAANR